MRHAKYLVSLTLTLITIYFCYYIAETYFFDKFFYQKSVKYGYISIKDENSNLKKYGNRSFYLNNIDSQTFDKNKFNIVIIGDSYVWGTGIKNNQRFSKLLENKLNQDKPTRVVSLGKPGWNIIDYLREYELISKYNPDIIIFTLVTNDIFVNPPDQVHQIVKNCSELFPNFRLTNDFEEEIVGHVKYSYTQLEQFAWSNPINKCILNSALKLLPSNNSAYYFMPDRYSQYDELYNIYERQLNESAKIVIYPDANHVPTKFQKYWTNSARSPWDKLTVSTREEHPNEIANELFTEILYNLIKNNEKWKAK